MFSSEYEAFKAYAEIYPDNCVLLVDTYNVLKSGIPNAIKVFKETKPSRMGVRIDSGDITYLTRNARAMLDAAGLKDCSIVVSNSLDEWIIRDVIQQGAKVDSFGVGERLITAKSEPVFGGVYKLAAVEKDGVIIPKMKISENVEKITNPGFKTLYRLYDKDTGSVMADVITLDHEPAPEGDDYVIFDPSFTWKRKKLSNFRAVNLRRPIIKGGELVYDLPSIDEIRSYCEEQTAALWDEMLRLENPQSYYVDLSDELWKLRTRLIENYGSAD
jgi:nicotinate phosphoribosyltransferase